MQTLRWQHQQELNFSFLSLQLLLCPHLFLFFYFKTFWLIWQELSSLSSCTVRLQWFPGTDFFWATMRLIISLGVVRYSCSWLSLVVSLLLTFVIYSSLFSDWRRTISSKLFDTKVPSVFTEELVLFCYVYCVVSPPPWSEHNLLLHSYFSRIDRIENPSCTVYGHPTQDPSHLVLHRPATEFLRRSLFGNSLALYDLWYRPYCPVCGTPWPSAKAPSDKRGLVTTK